MGPQSMVKGVRASQDSEQTISAINANPPRLNKVTYA